MAITIDYSDPAEYVINVPKADMTLVSSSPTEIRELDLDTFRQTLGDLQDDAAGIWAVTAFVHTPPLTISGVTLARVVEILSPYVVEFEDGAYNVNVVGGNSNVSDRTVKNTVGVNTANSAGLTETVTPEDLGALIIDGSGASDITLTAALRALYALAAGNVDRSGTDDRDATFYQQDGVTPTMRNRTTDTTRRPFT